MSRPSINVLIDNAIVATERNKILCCWLCNESRSKNWLDHISQRSHALRLKRFGANFENHRASFFCVECTRNYDWDVLESHAIEHGITPWYRPRDLEKIFFDNRMLELSDKYYCFSCDEIFLDWSSALVHTNNERHCDKLRNKESRNKNIDITKFGQIHGSLIQNGMYTWKDKNLACKICGCLGIAVESYANHIEDSCHGGKKLSLCKSLEGIANRKITQERMRENRIEWKRDRYYWCDYCKFLVNGMERVIIHVEGQRHRSVKWNPMVNGEESRRVKEQMRREREPIGSGEEPIGSSKESIRSGKEPIGSSKEPIRSGKEPIRSGNEPIRYGDEPIRSKNDPMSGKERIRSRTESIRSGKERLRSRNEPMRRRNEPIRSRNEPIMSKNEPIMSKNEQIGSKNKPIGSKNEPIGSKNEPIRNGKEPICSGEEPIRSRNEPIISRNEPIRNGKEPICSGEEPIRSRNEPIRSSNEPIRSSNEPIRSSNEPIRSSNEPIRSSNESIRSRNERIRSSNEPIRSRNERIRSRNEPIRSRNEPIRSRNEPIRSRNEPIRSRNEPIRSRHEPIRSRNEPIRSGREPIRSGREPMRSRNEPIRSGNEPIRSRNEPIRSGNEPIRSGNEPIRSGNEPVRSRNEPIRSRNEPIRSGNVSIRSGNEPIRSGREPIRSRNEPIGSRNEPIGSGNEPIGSGNGPIWDGKEPIRSGDEPNWSGKESIESWNEPIKSRNEPIGNTNEPIGSEKEPIQSDITKNPIDIAISNHNSLSHDYIVELADTTYKCNICRCKIHDKLELSSHSMSHRHVTLCEEFRMNEITFMGDGKWQCGLCNCLVYGLEPAFDHIDKKSHMSLLHVSTAEHERLRCENKIFTISNENQPIKPEMEKQSTDGSIFENEIFHDYIIKRGSTTFYCTICKCMIYSDMDIELHVSGKRHVNRCEKLNLRGIALEANDNRQIEATTVMKKINGENSDVTDFIHDFIVEKDDEGYYCAICDLTIVDLVNLRSHAEGISHVRRRSKFHDDEITFSNDKYRCRLCIYETSCLDDASEHINKRTHKKARSRMSQMLPVITNNISNDKQTRSRSCLSQKMPLIANNISNDTQTRSSPCLSEKLPPIANNITSNDTSASNEKLSDILKPSNDTIMTSEKLHDNIAYHCKICEQWISNIDENIINHIVGRRHTRIFTKLTNNGIKFVSDDDYHCEYCDCEIHGIADVRRHMKETEHITLKYKTKGQNDENLTNPKPAASSEKSDLSLKNAHYEYIIKYNCKDSLCKICDCVIYDGEASVEEHLAGNSHASSLQKYGCENIILVDAANRDYYCKSCHSRVKCGGQIWNHALTYKHTRALLMNNDDIINESRKLLILKYKKPKEKKSKRKTAGDDDEPPASVRSLFVNRFWKQQIDNSSKQVRCKVCKLILANILEYHSHLAAHFSKDFLHPHDNQENKENPSKDESELLTMISLNLSNESSITNDSEDDNSDSSTETMQVGLKKIVDKPDGKLLERRAKIPSIEKLRKIVNFNRNDIYDMREKFYKLELGTKLSYAKFSKNIYCLVCCTMTNFTSDNYHEHLSSIVHSTRLERMERDDKFFDKYPEQFSEIDLGLEYMEEISRYLVTCHVCDVKIFTDDNALREHINEESHARERLEMRDIMMKNFQRLRSLFKCDWYNIETYRCVPCLLTFRREINFVEHLAGKEHSKIMDKPVNKRRQLFYDFCKACALLWYGYGRTCGYHCSLDTHLWLARDGYYLSTKLPKAARELLTIMEFYINETIMIYDSSIADEQAKEEMLVCDMLMAVEGKYPRAKAHMFGSRVTRLGSLDCDIDVFLDCDEMYDGKIESRKVILKYMENVAECLNKEPQSWLVEELVKMCTSPIIKVHHIKTGLSCDISFQNGLGVEKTNLIKSYIDAFPLCREMIIFLKRWTTLCELSGSERITSYALYWHVIFYLQSETILPSVEELIKIENQSRTIKGFEVGASRDFTCNMANNNFTVKQHISRFFNFWANFDHRYDVACPMIGKTLKKRDFVSIGKMSDDESYRYEDHVRKSMDRADEPLRIDSAMCIQDPLDLRYNMTQALGKVYVNRFRKYCSYSFDIIGS